MANRVSSKLSRSTQYASRPKPWHHHLTIDLLASIINSTLLHPIVAWTFPLILRAVATPYTTLASRLTTAYAVLVTLLFIYAQIDRRHAFGAPRRVKWEDEVVVITGGASGLGLVLAEVYGMRGVSVAVLDVQSVDTAAMEKKGIAYYKCDVGDWKAMESVKKKVKQDLGTPTIIIHAAATTTTAPLLHPSLTPSRLEAHYTTNILSTHNLYRTFLPDMLARPNGGTIVTVASVLGLLGCAALGSYTAAKAAQIALHRSLSAELKLMTDANAVVELGGRLASPASSQSSDDGNAEEVNKGAQPQRQYPHRIKTVLLTLGHLATPLFANVPPPPLSHYLGPVLAPHTVAAEIVKVVDAGEGGEIAMPFYVRWVWILNAMPVGLRELVRKGSGLDWAGWLGFFPRGSNSVADEWEDVRQTMEKDEKKRS